MGMMVSSEAADMAMRAYGIAHRVLDEEGLRLLFSTLASVMVEKPGASAEQYLDAVEQIALEKGMLSET